MSTSSPDFRARHELLIQLDAEDGRLLSTIKAIRADERYGHITAQEAADNIAAAISAYTAKCQEIRQAHERGEP